VNNSNIAHRGAHHLAPPVAFQTRMTHQLLDRAAGDDNALAL
jgi:hypothetical protein